MFQRRTSGSVVCPSCGSLVGVRDDRCYTCGRANPGLWGFAPAIRQLGSDFGFAPFVVGASSILYLVSLLLSGAALQTIGPGLAILAPSQQALLLLGASGAIPVFGLGRWWTVLSASWLHGHFLHILFNMMWVRQLGPAAAEVIGPARTVIIYTVAGATGFALSTLAGSGLTMGASASIFGLLGALVHYGRKSGSSLIHGEALRYAIILFVFGLFMPGIDNFAHAGGFFGGYIASAFMNPLARERDDHLIAAVCCLAATFLSVLVSFVTSLT